MNSMHPLRKALFIGALGAATGFGIGCVLVAGDISKECGDVGSHSMVDGEDCVCEAGYDWCDPNDDDDKSCCEPDGACPDPNSSWLDGLCYCDPGFDWCNPDDPNDFTCCGGGDTDSGSGGKTTTDGTGGATDTAGTGGTGGGDECPAGTPPDPSECTTDNEGEFYCTNTADQGPNCSKLYTCMNGEWVEDTTSGDEECQFNQFDFAYGCVDTGGVDGFVEIICGMGPGTACDSSEPSFCEDADNIHWCLYGKLTEDSCLRICQEVGDEMGATYDHGECTDDGSSADCGCCDIGDAGCNAGGTGTTG